MLSVDDSVDVLRAHPKPLSKFRKAMSSISQRSNLENLARRQLGARGGFAATDGVSIPCVHIMRVLGPRPGSKVGRVYARWVVARMKNVKPFGNRPIRDLPRKSVSIPPVVVSAGAKASVAAGQAGRHPLPTFVWTASVDVLPEPCNHAFIHGTYPPVGHGPGRSSAAGPSAYSTLSDT